MQALRDGLKVLSELSQRTPAAPAPVNFRERREAEKFLKKVGLSDTPTLIDQYGSIGKRLGVTQALPRTFLVDGWGHRNFCGEGGDERCSSGGCSARELSSQEALRLQGQEVLTTWTTSSSARSGPRRLRW